MHRILWFDDEWTSIPEMKEDLENNGFIVDCAGTLTEAREIIEKQKYKLIILDMIVPYGDVRENDSKEIIAKPFLGLEFLKDIEKENSEETPIIVILSIAVDERLSKKIKKYVNKKIVNAILKKDLELTIPDVTSIVKKQLSHLGEL